MAAAEARATAAEQAAADERQRADRWTVKAVEFDYDRQLFAGQRDAALARVAELEGLLREAAETVAHYTYGCRYRGDLVDRIRAALAQTGAE